MLNSNDDLSHYLAGLIEGDGTFITPKTQLSGQPTISIVFDIRDLPLADRIKKELGFGSITIPKKKPIVPLMLDRMKDLLNYYLS